MSPPNIALNVMDPLSVIFFWVLMVPSFEVVELELLSNLKPALILPFIILFL